MAPCPVCKGKQYIIALRDDDREAVEACDACTDRITFCDTDAAVLANYDGIECNLTYPCYLVE